MRNPLSFLILFLAHLPLLAQPDPGFRWVNPLPTGETLWDVERVADGVFVAVSENGFILRSEDRGMSWSYYQNRLLENFWSVDAADGVVVVGAEGGVAYVSSDQGLSWKEIHIPDFSQNLRGVAVIDRNHWVTVGSTLSNNGVVVVTRDGGETWKFVDPGVPVAFRSVCFIDSLHGWASGTPGTIVSTSDGGDSWQVDQSPLLYGPSLNVVSFASENRGIAAGSNGRLFVTTDGGENWEARPQRAYSEFMDVAWLNDTTVVLIGDRQQIRSTDAGQTWSEILAGARPLGMGFGANVTEGMVAGVDGLALYTSDGGRTWTNRSSGAPGRNIYDLTIHESGVGYAVGYQGGVIRSDDRGATWWWTERIPPNVPRHLTLVAVPSENSVVAVAEEGAVYHSSTKGDRWSNDLVRTDRRLYDMSFGDSLNGWIVGYGVIFHSTNGGASWRGDSTSLPYGLAGVHALNATRVYVTGDNGRLFLTEDGGETWQEIDNEFTVRFSMVKADPEGNITLGWLGGTVHSTDGGVTWSDYRAAPDYSLRHFSFLSPTVGWCGQHSGPFLMTTDAGKTWETREHGLRTSQGGNAAMSVVEMIGPGYGFVAGSSGFILEYRDPDISSVPSPPTADRSNRPESRSQLLIHLDNGQLTVSRIPTSATTLHIYDAQGRLVGTFDLSGSPTDRASFNIDRLAAGVYIIVEQGSGSYGSFVKN